MFFLSWNQFPTHLEDSKNNSSVFGSISYRHLSNSYLHFHLDGLCFENCKWDKVIYSLVWSREKQFLQPFIVITLESHRNCQFPNAIYNQTGKGVSHNNLWDCIISPSAEADSWCKWNNLVSKFDWEKVLCYKIDLSNNLTPHQKELYVYCRN